MNLVSVQCVSLEEAHMERQNKSHGLLLPNLQAVISIGPILPVIYDQKAQCPCPLPSSLYQMSTGQQMQFQLHWPFQ